MGACCSTQSKSGYGPTARRMKRPVGSQDEPDKIRIVFAGDRQVGKSALILRMAKNEFNELYQGTVYEVFDLEIQKRNKKYILEITDTGGENFEIGTNHDRKALYEN